ncbi:MAG: hypothetical protein Q7U60_04825 [Candidatus Methanoperedens sp.]|nr:hypothetical protein [Candidatus Methanoperedens sp.]
MKLRKDWYFLARLCLLVVGLGIAAIGIIDIFRNSSEVNSKSIFPVLIGLLVAMSSFFWMLKPRTGVAGDERTKRAVEKAGFWAYMILVSCLLLQGLINSLWEATKDFRLMPFVFTTIGLISWGILTIYFDKKGDVE